MMIAFLLNILLVCRCLSWWIELQLKWQKKLPTNLENLTNGNVVTRICSLEHKGWFLRVPTHNYFNKSGVSKDTALELCWILETFLILTHLSGHHKDCDTHHLKFIDNFEEDHKRRSTQAWKTTTVNCRIKLRSMCLVLMLKWESTKDWHTCMAHEKGCCTNTSYEKQVHLTNPIFCSFHIWLDAFVLFRLFLIVTDFCTRSGNTFQRRDRSSTYE